MNGPSVPPPKPSGSNVQPQSILVGGMGLSVMAAPRRRPMAPPPTEPNKTIYIRNLNEKISLKILRRSLEAIFSSFGNILELRASKCIKLRGQAFVTYDNQESATKALNEAQGFPLFSLPMDIQYARDKNYIFYAEEGTLEIQKKRRAEEKAQKAQEPKKPKPEASIGSTGWFPGGAPIPAEFLPPNNILFIENLPPETTQQILSDLFNQFPGFKEVRLVPGKSDIAFVEYETEAQSTLAKQQLNFFKITPEREMKVTFARKFMATPHHAGTPTAGQYGVPALHGQAAFPMKRPEQMASQQRKKKVLDRALPRKIDSYVPEAKLYSELCDLESRLDATIIRKRQDIHEASTRPLKTLRTLRIYLANLAFNQGGDDPMTTGDVDNANIPSWTLQIQGRLLDPPNSRKLSNQPKFSTFVRSIIVHLDRDPALYPEGNVIEFRRSPGFAEFDGVEVKRKGDSDVRAKIYIYLESNPEKYVVTDALRELIGVSVDTKSNIIMALWQYIKINKLQDVDDKTLIKLDDALSSIFKVQRISLSQLPDVVMGFLRPCEPVYIEYTIKVDQEYTLSNIAYDVEVEVDDPVTAQMNKIAMLGDPNTQKEISELNEQIAKEVEEINAFKLKRDFMLAFAKDPSGFLNEWVASQSRDLEVILGDTRFNTEEVRRSSFYREPWVRDAVFHFVNQKI
ncbi:SWI/SNF complex component snf12 [Phlyctochytrium bullatum]|nr:SWI/SNF complex component snf12 [Phlyctochytrium bullatum]